MTQQEIKELRDLRNEDQLLKDKIQALESEIMDVNMRLDFLMRSKKGKGVALLISTICFVLSAAALISYSLMYMETAGTRMKGYADTVVFSVTATMLPFLVMFVIIFAVLTTVLAIRLVMDLFPSEGAYRSAVRWHRVNIPHEKQVCMRQKAEMEKSLAEFNRERNDIKNRLEELSKMEHEMLFGY